MGYINASKIAQYPPDLNRYQHVDDDSSVLWLEKAQSGKVSMEDIKEALAEFIKLFKVGMASKAEILTLARAFPDSPVYTEAARKQSEKDDDEPVVIGGPASVSLVDREGHLITTGALERAFKKFMDNDRTRNVMVLHSDVQVGWALPAYISKGGQIFKSGVNDNGLFFICELRDDTAIAKKVSDQIHKGMLKSYSIAGSATRIQNMTKGLVPYLQVDDMELAEVTICEKGVNQGAGFELLKAETPSIPKSPQIIAPIRKINMRSNDDGTINFNKSFSSWMQKEAKDPLTTKESFVTLNNEAGRKAEHEQLMREYGFPSEQSYETMRYVPVVETETDDDGIPIHNLPPWVVNEAGEALGDRLDEDAPDYDKSDKAKARQKAGSAQKMFYDFMEIEKAPKKWNVSPPPKSIAEDLQDSQGYWNKEGNKYNQSGKGRASLGSIISRQKLQKVKARLAESDQKRRTDQATQQRQAQSSADSSKRRSPRTKLGRTAARIKRDAPGQLRAGATRAGEVGREALVGGKRGLQRMREAFKRSPKPETSSPLTAQGTMGAEQSRIRMQREANAARGPSAATRMGQMFRGGRKRVGGAVKATASGIRQAERKVRGGAREYADAVKAGRQERQGLVDRVDAWAAKPPSSDTADKPKYDQQIPFGGSLAPGKTNGDNGDTAVSRLRQGVINAPRRTQQSKPEGRGFLGRAGARRDRDTQAARQAHITDTHRTLGFGSDNIFTSPTHFNKTPAQIREQTIESRKQPGDKSLSDHLAHYADMVGTHPETGQKIGHVTVHSLPEGHHYATSMNANEFHNLIQDGHVSVNPIHGNFTNWKEFADQKTSQMWDVNHIPPPIAEPKPKDATEQGATDQGTVGQGAVGQGTVGQGGTAAQPAAGTPSAFRIDKPAPPLTQEEMTQQYKPGPRPPEGGMGGTWKALDKMLFKALGVKKRVNR